MALLDKPHYELFSFIVIPREPDKNLARNIM